jgi:hypothetical protein
MDPRNIPTFQMLNSGKKLSELSFFFCSVSFSIFTFFFLRIRATVRIEIQREMVENSTVYLDHRSGVFFASRLQTAGYMWVETNIDEEGCSASRRMAKNSIRV